MIFTGLFEVYYLRYIIHVMLTILGSNCFIYKAGVGVQQLISIRKYELTH